MNMHLYNKYQIDFLTADLIEWRAESLLGYAIRACTKQNVNHTSGIILSSIVGSSIIRRDIWEADERGFHATHLSQAIKNYSGEVYWLQLKSEYNWKRVQIAEIAQSLEGRPYDYWSLIKNIRRPVKLSDRTIFCSEAWHIALLRAGLLSEDFNDGLALRPGEFGRTNLYKEPVLIYTSKWQRN